MPLSPIGRSFRRDTRGSIAIYFAATMTLAFAAVGSAVDYGRSLAVQTQMQHAADAAALAAAVSSETSERGLKAVADKFLLKNPVSQYLSLPDASDLKFMDRKSGSFEYQLFGRSENVVMSLFGYPVTEVAVKSAVNLNSSELELALVLDNTYSMTTVGANKRTRLETLKMASKDLIQAIKPNPNNNVRVAVVPFVDYVNVGLENRQAPWMSVPPDSKTVGERVCEVKDVYEKFNCRYEDKQCEKDGVSEECEKKICEKRKIGTETECSTPTEEFEWRGCVGSRPEPFSTAPNADGVPYPGVMNKSCATEVTPLTSIEGRAISAISAMEARNETYITAGMLWGINVLTPEAPYTEGRAFDSTNENRFPRKTIILMTDGTNTRSLKQPYHNGEDKEHADTMLLEECNIAKKLGIEVFTVSFGVTDKSTEDLLMECASSPDKFFDTDSDEEFLESFGAISSDLKGIRLVK
ncbi:pilus assembly protein TadG-related protein [Chthonobacter albigriseus]|uniref:pilus assembly protein TadG-related protein n=1 Tax=Chthonobacter albigriseus TaxID=1683161 RepID=UPI0015EF5112|nr:pilus assembly protein TadG-related protein [Chthonobacter albigriseus]